MDNLRRTNLKQNPLANTQIAPIEATQVNGVSSYIWSALKNSLYAGAKDESIKMVLDYCRAGDLDPMQKPVHIVPMTVTNAQTGRKERKDTVMAGIALYRIQAARSNQCAGISEPEYGSDITTDLGGVKITYPEWCRVTVKKIIQGLVVEFTSKEYWLENYAKQRSDTDAPNSMWRKRPFGQLAKCAEAQALRKAFPEIVTHHPTAEEMEGKSYIEQDVTTAPQETSLDSKLDNFLAQEDCKKDEQMEEMKVQVKTELPTSAEQEILSSKLRGLIKQHNVSAELLEKWCNAGKVDSVEKLDDVKLQSCIDYILDKMEV